MMKMKEILNDLKNNIIKGVKGMATSSIKRNQVNKLSRWVKGFKSEGLNIKIPRIEGLVYNKSGTLSVKSTQEALNSLQASLGGTVSKWIKNNPDEYAAVLRARERAKKFIMMQARMYARDEAFDEFLDWYNANDSQKAAVQRLMNTSPEFKSTISGLGKAYQSGNIDAGYIRDELDHLQDEFYGERGY